jgi:hypothetical protein
LSNDSTFSKAHLVSGTLVVKRSQSKVGSSGKCVVAIKYIAPNSSGRRTQMRLLKKVFWARKSRVGFSLPMKILRHCPDYKRLYKSSDYKAKKTSSRAG